MSKYRDIAFITVYSLISPIIKSIQPVVQKIYDFQIYIVVKFEFAIKSFVIFVTLFHDHPTTRQLAYLPESFTTGGTCSSGSGRGAQEHVIGGQIFIEC